MTTNGQTPNQNLASRLANRLGANQQAQANTPQQTANTRAAAQPPAPPAAPAPAQRQNAFGGGNNQRSWTMQPILKTVVRFDLRGLGDPFYRLLGQGLNPEFGDSEIVTAALERGGEHVLELGKMLDKSWENYKLQGASLVYSWNKDDWDVITKIPSAPPQNNEDEEGQAVEQRLPIQFVLLRAIDLQLVLNVLGRSRSQVLMTRAPLIFSQQYLNRALFSDDPRLVTLVKATGYLEEG